jgi:DNA polymerase III epsilon subunit-like protein
MFIFLDTETTGNGPDDRLCQIAFKPENGQAVCELFNPGRPISIDVSVSDRVMVFFPWCHGFFLGR